MIRFPYALWYNEMAVKRNALLYSVELRTHIVCKAVYRNDVISLRFWHNEIVVKRNA